MKHFDLSLYLVTEESLCRGSDLLALVEAAARGGVTLIQLRRKHGLPSETVALGKALQEVLRPWRIPLIVNDSPALAKEIGVAGVHLGRDDLSPREARAYLGAEAIIGLSIGSVEELKPERLQYVDYIAASPVFVTSTKSDAGAPLLLEGLAKLRRLCALPLVAIGGINLSNVREVMAAGADGAAVVSAIFGAENAELAARNLVREIGSRGKPCRVLTIAGSDSGGGAGIQADLKTFEALGCYGMSAITALTVQNTSGVRGILAVPADFVSAQIEAVLEDIGADAVKLGMLHSAPVIEAVAKSLRSARVNKVVLDPVMLAKGGARLLESDAVRALKEHLFPLVSVLTPNLPEAEVLTGNRIKSRAEMERALEKLLTVCPRVVLKGGHLESEDSPDLYGDSDGTRLWLESPRIETRNTHGTGCTYSAAIAVYAARGVEWKDAVVSAREYLQGALLGSSQWKMGQGTGPLHHAWQRSGGC